MGVQVHAGPQSPPGTSIKEPLGNTQYQEEMREATGHTFSFTTLTATVLDGCRSLVTSRVRRSGIQAADSSMP